LREALADAEKRMNLGDGFFDRLDRLDDWTLIIVSATLIDAAIHRLLVAGLKKGRVKAGLDDFLWDSLDASRRRRLAINLGLLSEENGRLAEQIAEIRNYAAHRLEGVAGFSVPAYFEKLKQERRKKLAVAFFPLDVGGSGFEPSSWNKLGRAYVALLVRMLVAGLSISENLERLGLGFFIRQ
jgi:hypothetical protein